MSGDEKSGKADGEDLSKELAIQVKVAIQNNHFYDGDSLLPALLPVMEQIRPGSLSELTELSLNEVRLGQGRYR